jgi:hypothetical protein
MFQKNPFIHHIDQNMLLDYGPSLFTNDQQIMDLTNNLQFGPRQHQVVILVTTHALAICWTENMQFRKAITFVHFL